MAQARGYPAGSQVHQCRLWRGGFQPNQQATRIKMARCRPPMCWPDRVGSANPQAVGEGQMRMRATAYRLPTVSPTLPLGYAKDELYFFRLISFKFVGNDALLSNPEHCFSHYSYLLRRCPSWILSPARMAGKCSIFRSELLRA